MSYQVLYRTYRPSRFDEVVGQEYIVKILKNTIKNKRIAHAYLFAGPRGTGKTTIAKLFAKAINCEDFNEEACDNCPSCLAFKENNHPDIIELDAASNNSVDDIREIIEQVPYSPIVGKYKVYIIDEVHMLSSSAFNALLKTLEEPPAHVVFILATTDPQKIIPTVLSRCQRYNFSKISNLNMEKKMVEILNKEHLQYEDKALDEVAMLAEGGMRDALSILEQVLSYNNDGIFLEDVQRIFGLSTKEEKVELLIKIHNDLTGSINLLRQMYDSGIDPKRLCVDLLEIIKESLIYSDDQNETLLNKLSKFDCMNILDVVSVNDLLSDITYLEEALNKARSNQSFLTYLELAEVKMGGNSSKHTIKTKPAITQTVTRTVVEEPKVETVVAEEVKEEPQVLVEEPVVEQTITEDIPNGLESGGSNLGLESDAPIETNEAPIITPEPIMETLVQDFTGGTSVEEEHEVLNEQPIDIEYLAALLLTANKNEKVSDSIIYNRLEMYKLDPDKRKFYELLRNTDLFASGKDVIIVTGPKLYIDNINATENRNELYRFFMEEFGLDKVIYGVEDNKRGELISIYKNLMANKDSKSPIVQKPVIEKEMTNEDKAKLLFDNVRVED
ncbi:MAG: DNA polymerase III subunit gamma/tau [Solobacterium sp.]|nr:DNA polymerase III subunit gamma/tau [Solobacterium sp.]MDY5402237.1 DNA polymerase III subunit gamma/tau [Erysipelotrichaceae bacterium]